MHQDEHNQAEQPDTAGLAENQGPEALADSQTPVTSPDPALANAAPSMAAPPEPSFAETPFESPEDTAVAVTEEPPAFGESLYAKPAWMSADPPSASSPATLEEAVDLPEPPASPEAPAYASPSWSSSDQREAAPSVPRVDFAQAPPDWVPLNVNVDTAHYSQTPESGPGDAFEGVPAPPPVWMAPPISDAPAEGASEPRSYERPAEPHIEMPQGGPNWMLAFVCAWAAFTSFMEAPVAYAAKETMINGSSVTLTAGDRLYGGLGFALLGLGLLLFGIEALLWGRRRRGVSALLSIGLPVIVSLAGIVCLVLSHYPGSRI